MPRGYDRPLYLLPFDHRDSYASGMFKAHNPPTPEERDAISDSKAVIYEGFLSALTQGVPTDYAGILVDEQYGLPLLRDAAARGVVTAVSTEKSGQRLFGFEYADFAAHLEALKPTFAKVLVRYNPEDPQGEREAQQAPLRQLSDWCAAHAVDFMFELLVPATEPQLASVGADKARYDLEMRPELMFAAMRELQQAGIEPDVWKVEGLASVADYRKLVATARAGGRDRVGSIVLGRGADDDTVEAWLRTAAQVDGMIGFAVGRTCFWDAIAGYESKTLDRTTAAETIAANYRHWVDVFESGRAARAH